MDSWNPEQYHRFQRERSAPFFDLLALIERVGQPRVIDLGCGTGELTAAAHDRLAARETIGIDRSPAMLATAQQLDVRGLSFQLGDLSDPVSLMGGRERGAGFDVILSNAALHWVPDHAAVLSRWSDALVADGQLAVQMPANFDHPSHRLAADLARETPFAPLLADGRSGDPAQDVLAPESYATLLHDLGFARQHVRLQVYAHVLASTDEVVEWVKGTTLTRYREQLPPDLFDDFLSRYREQLLAELGHHEPYFYAFKRILLWARR